MSTVPLGVLLAFGCAVAWAFANVFIQRAARELGDLRAMFWAQILGGLLFLGATLLLGRPTRWPAPGLLLATGAASALGYYGMLRAFRQGPLSVVTPYLTTWPLAAAILGVVVFGERPDLPTVAGGLLIVGGAAGNGALAEGGEWLGPKGQTIGWALAGAVGFGCMTAGVARLAPDLGPWACTPVVWAAQWVVLAPLVLRAPRAFAPPPRWRNVAGMAALESLGFFCFTVATRLAPLAVVSPPASISTPLTVLWARVLLGERVGPARALCVGLALVGTVLISRA